MTCREFIDFLMGYLANDLPPDVLEAFERHVSVCVNCEEYLGQYRATVEAGRVAFADPDAQVPEEVPEELVRAIMASRDRDQGA